MYKLNYKYVPVKPGTYPDGTYPEVLLEHTSPTQAHWRKLVNNLNGLWCYSDNSQTSSFEINQQGTIEFIGTGVGLSYSNQKPSGTQGLYNFYNLPITSFDETKKELPLLSPFTTYNVNGITSPWTIIGEERDKPVSIKYTGLNLTEYIKSHPNLVSLSDTPDHLTVNDFLNNKGEVSYGYLYRIDETSPYHYDSNTVKISNPFTFKNPQTNINTKRLFDKKSTFTIHDNKLININMNNDNIDFHSTVLTFNRWIDNVIEPNTSFNFIKTIRLKGNKFNTGKITLDKYQELRLTNWYQWNEQTWKLIESSIKSNTDQDDYIPNFPLDINHVNVTKIIPVLSRQSVIIPLSKNDTVNYSLDKYKTNTTNYGIPNSSICYEYLNSLENSLLDNSTIYTKKDFEVLKLIKHPFAGIKNYLSENAKQVKSIWFENNRSTGIEVLNNKYTVRPVVINQEYFDPNYDQNIRRNCYPFEMETNEDYSNVIGLPQNYIDHRTLHWTNHREKPILKTIKLAIESNDDWRYGAKEIIQNSLVQVMGNSIEFYKGDIIYNETVLSNHFNALLPYPTQDGFHEHERIGNKYWQLRHRYYSEEYNDRNNTKQYKFQNEAKVPLFIVPLSNPKGNSSIVSAIENLTVTERSEVLVGFSLDLLNENYNTIFIAKEGFRFDEIESPEYIGKVLAFKLAGQEDKVELLNSFGREEDISALSNPQMKTLLGRQLDRLKRYCVPLRSRMPDGRFIRYDSRLYRFDLNIVEIEDIFTTMIDKIEYITTEDKSKQPILLESRYGKFAIIKDAFTIYNHGLSITVELTNPDKYVGVELPIDLDELSIDPRFRITSKDLFTNIPSGYIKGGSELITIDDRSTQVYINLDKFILTGNIDGYTDEKLKSFLKDEIIISNRWLNNEVRTKRKGSILYSKDKLYPYSGLMELDY